MATTGITVALQAVDQTAAAFGSAQSRFAAFSQSITQMTARVSVFARVSNGIGAFAEKLVLAHRSVLALVYGAEKLTAPFRNVAREMHELTDRAQETGSKASDVLKLSQAFGELGVKGADLESVTRVLNYMRKNTGDLGVAGFARQMKAIAAIGDETARVTELTRVFGREGVRLEFLLRRGPEAFEKSLRSCMAVMPDFSDSVINAASEADKAFDWISRDISARWKTMVGEMILRLSGTIDDGIEAGLAIAWEQFKAFFRRLGLYMAEFALVAWNAIKGIFVGIPKLLWNVLKGVGGAIAEFGVQVWSAIKGNGFDWSKIGAELSDGWDAGIEGLVGTWDAELLDGAEKALDEVRAETEAKIKAIREHFAQNGPAEKGADEAADTLSAAASKISDALNPATWMDAAGYAARTLGLAARNAVGGAAAALRAGVSSVTAVRGTGGAATSSSALASIRPLVSQILDAIRENGRAASGFYNAFAALEAV